jgi:membrane protein implicated in regulation of membrane protease activity
MDVYISLSYWLFLPEFWIIAGIILICLELVDGSLIFFLPLGLGSFLNALTLFLQENENIFDYQVISVWHHSLVTLAVYSIIISFCFKWFSKRKSEEDINKY